MMRSEQNMELSVGSILKKGRQRAPGLFQNRFSEKEMRKAYTFFTRLPNLILSFRSRF